VNIFLCQSTKQSSQDKLLMVTTFPWFANRKKVVHKHKCKLKVVKSKCIVHKHKL
jgi:hypothetical protein